MMRVVKYPKKLYVIVLLVVAAIVGGILVWAVFPRTVTQTTTLTREVKVPLPFDTVSFKKLVLDDYVPKSWYQRALWQLSNVKGKPSETTFIELPPHIVVQVESLVKIVHLAYNANQLAVTYVAPQESVARVRLYKGVEPRLLQVKPTKVGVDVFWKKPPLLSASASIGVYYDLVGVREGFDKSNLGLTATCVLEHRKSGLGLFGAVDAGSRVSVKAGVSRRF